MIRNHYLALSPIPGMSPITIAVDSEKNCKDMAWYLVGRRFDPAAHHCNSRGEPSHLIVYHPFPFDTHIFAQVHPWHDATQLVDAANICDGLATISQEEAFTLLSTIQDGHKDLRTIQPIDYWEALTHLFPGNT